MLLSPPDLSKITNLIQGLPSVTAGPLPSTSWAFTYLQSLTSQLPSLCTEAQTALRGTAQDAARAYATVYALEKALEEAHKAVQTVKNDMKDFLVPQAFEFEGVTNVPLSEGARVGVQYKVRASIRGGQKLGAFQHLRDINCGDMITQTVNASSLSSLASEMLKEDNEELPENLFSVEVLPTTSVTWKKVK
jgi:hypothetical protein